jgi:DNA-binding response OmpR family regulator
MKRSIHIAVIEDDDNIRELLTENLKTAGYHVSPFFTAEQFERKVDGGYNLLLLDIMLPGKSGIALLKDLSIKGYRFPVILVTASEQEAHIDSAFATGAIDYIIKPFNLKHLLLKIENLLEQIAAAGSKGDKQLYTIGAGIFDSELQLAIRDKKEHKLTPSEATTLHYFIQNSNRIITREELQSQISGESKNLSSRNLDNYILKFRKLFELDPKEPLLFVTIPRKGYALKR